MGGGYPPEDRLVAERPWENRRAFYPQVPADERSGRLPGTREAGGWYGTLPAVPPDGPTLLILSRKRMEKEGLMAACHE